MAHNLVECSLIYPWYRQASIKYIFHWSWDCAMDDCERRVSPMQSLTPSNTGPAQAGTTSVQVPRYSSSVLPSDRNDGYWVETFHFDLEHDRVPGIIVWVTSKDMLHLFLSWSMRTDLALSLGSLSFLTIQLPKLSTKPARISSVTMVSSTMWSPLVVGLFCLCPTFADSLKNGQSMRLESSTLQLQSLQLILLAMGSWILWYAMITALSC